MTGTRQPDRRVKIARSPILADPSRLRALRATGLLDRDPSPSLDRLVRLASRILGAPVSLVSLVEADRQFFASQVGLIAPYSESRETPLSHSFCKQVVESGDALVITDALTDARVADNPAIQELHIRSYAGVPLTGEEDGHVLGSFCVIDDEPREWTQEELEILRDLADAAMTEIRLRRAANDIGDALDELQRQMDRG
ncbi:MAG: GAF domain-containing protein [Longimicrobiales bacterium]|nr:GAF domain-containing protein [Longimicrobiales bacterium]